MQCWIVLIFITLWLDQKLVSLSQPIRCTLVLILAPSCSSWHIVDLFSFFLFFFSVTANRHFPLNSMSCDFSCTRLVHWSHHIKVTSFACVLTLFTRSISLHILHTVLYTFPKAPPERNCLTIKRFFGCWSFLLFSWAQVIRGWYCKENLEVSLSQGSKD